MLPGAIDQINAAIAFSASSTQRNQEGPDGHGPTVKIRHPEMEEVEIGRPRQMVAKECRIIGDRHQHEDRKQEGYAEPPGAVGQELG